LRGGITILAGFGRLCDASSVGVLPALGAFVLVRPVHGFGPVLNRWVEENPRLLGRAGRSEAMTDLPPLPDGAAEFVREAIEEEHGYLSWLGTEVGAVERGRIELAVPFDEKLTNPSSGGATIHGGVAATLVDTAGGLALRLAAEDPLATGVATVTLNVNYLRRATGDLHATADVVRAGSTVGVSRVEVTSTVPSDADEFDWGGEPGEERLVATGQPAYRLFR
jgi:uncharacterized protein (TIGR00369 family)